MHALYFLLGCLCGAVGLMLLTMLGEHLAACRERQSRPLEFPNDVLTRRAFERADAVGRDRVLTREEHDAFTRKVGL